MIMYKLLPPDMFGQQNYVQRLSDFAQIPFSNENTDYQAYLKWLEEGNEPLPADEVTQ
jgi:hypothetical protein